MTTNWFLFREILKGQYSGLNSASIDELNEEITQKFISAAYNAFNTKHTKKYLTNNFREPDKIHNLMLKNIPDLITFVSENEFRHGKEFPSISIVNYKAVLFHQPLGQYFPCYY
ncbi:hypothetical protein BpHYR1_042908 [Brachionus plicatilis]|uniref:Uncharacterized protein n=1 Tax=Brachionus plicatilis TaxID=10195 RepID=A0A3M7T4S7_BRAPC|nr:hypothetical protein BpHYR1_042908 [Brachionus plicatilis]